jgi:hypothetical protein
MVLGLTPEPQQETELQQLMEVQHDPRSPNFHRWLKADAFAQRFAAWQDDVDRVRAWLEGTGLHVEGLHLHFAATLLLIGLSSMVFGWAKSRCNFALTGGFVLLVTRFVYGCAGGEVVGVVCSTRPHRSHPAI